MDFRYVHPQDSPEKINATITKHFEDTHKLIRELTERVEKLESDVNLLEEQMWQKEDKEEYR